MHGMLHSPQDKHMGNLFDPATMWISPSPLGHILDERETFDPDSLLKQEKLICYCNTVWVQYELEGGQRWVLDSTLN